MGSKIITGLELTGSAISWTSLRRKKKRLETVGQGRKDVVLAEADSDIVLESEEVVRSLKKAVHGLEGLICTDLPASKMLLRVTELPSTDSQELASMVELQVDKFCPFPLEQMVFSYEVLQERETSTRVLIIAVSRALVDGLGAAFRKCGIILYRLDSRLLAWWALLRQHGGLSEHGQQSVLIVELRDVSLIVLHHGLPVVFRSIGMHEKYVTEAEVDELLKEIDFTLTTLEAEWETAEEMKMSVWSHGELPDLLRVRLEQDTIHGAVFHQLEDLPEISEGLALRALDQKYKPLNLAPTGWAEDDKYRNSLRKVGLMSVLYLSCWASAIVFFVVYINMQQKQLDQLQSGQSGLQLEVHKIHKLKSKIVSLEQFSNRSHSALESLREISELLSAGVDLTSFLYKKGDQVKLKGTALQAAPIHDFIASLEKSGMFVQVTPGNIVSKRRRDNQVRTEFTITLVLPGDNEE